MPTWRRDSLAHTFAEISGMCARRFPSPSLANVSDQDMLVEATCAVAFQKGELHHAHMRQSTDELLAASGFVDCTCCSCLWRRQDYLKKNPAGMRQLSIHKRQQQKANRRLGTHIKLTCSSPRCNWCCICVGFWTSACMTSRRAYRDPEHDSVVSSSFINAIFVRCKPHSWLMRPFEVLQKNLFEASWRARLLTTLLTTQIRGLLVQIWMGQIILGSYESRIWTTDFGCLLRVKHSSFFGG